MDGKEMATNLIFWVGIVYLVACLLRFKTKYRASFREVGCIVFILLVLLVIVPVILAATPVQFHG